MTHHEKLRGNYEDAVFYLLMDQLANEQGRKYQQINDELKNDPAYEVPDEISKSCYRTIKREFSKVYRADRSRLAKRVFQQVAILIAVLIALVSGALAISPSLRDYALNLALETFDDHTSIRFFTSETNAETDALITGWLPTGYIRTNISDSNEMWKFEDGDGHWMILIVEPDGAEINLDTEGASLVEDIHIGGNFGVYVEKEEDHSLVWGKSDTGQVFTLLSNGLEKSEMKKVAENIL